MTRSGPPDDPNYTSGDDPTQYASYGNQGYGDQAYAAYQGGEPTGPYDQYQTGAQYEPEPETPWYRKPGPLVGLGALAVLLVAAIVYLAINLAEDDSAPTDVTTTTSSSETSSAAIAPEPSGTVTVTESPSPSPSDETTAPPSTTTTTAPPTTTTTTTPPPTTSTSTSTSTSTVTETSTATQTVTESAPTPASQP